jgi:hypothetical protein
MPVFGAEICTNGTGVCEVGQDTLAVGHPDNPFPFPQVVPILDTSDREQATLADWQNCQDNGNCGNIGYYTFRGFKAMARGALDVGQLMNADIPAGTFRLYAEAALLGVESQPYYYDQVMERMPLMAGVDIPTFGILDRLSAEVEYHKSRFRNNIYSVNQSQLPLPLTGPNFAGGIGPGGYAYEGVEEDTDDDLRWSFFASRRITDGVSIHAQMASDHMRHPDFWGVMSDEPATRDKTEWYYVVRVDFGF